MMVPRVEQVEEQEEIMEKTEQVEYNHLERTLLKMAAPISFIFLSNFLTQKRGLEASLHAHMKE